MAQLVQTDTIENPTVLYSAPRKYEIAGITVSGIDNYEDYVLIGISGLSVGQVVTIPGEEITAAVKRYWKHVMVYFSVILNDVTDGNDEIILMGIDIRYLTIEEDGICALAADQAAVDAAVQAALAEAGYTGSYSLRITFVPADGGGELDYAITLDEKKA